MYLTEEDLILLIIKALIKKKQGGEGCGCSIQRDMDEIIKADEKMSLKNGTDAPVFTSETVVSSVLPASPSKILGVRKSTVLPPSPRGLTSGALPPSPRGLTSSAVGLTSGALPPSPRSSVISPPSPRDSVVLPPSPRASVVLPPSPRVSQLSSLSYKSNALPSIQKSPTVTRTSLPKLSNLTQLK